jgi:iron complex outermembrane receptor protein
MMSLTHGCRWTLLASTILVGLAATPAFAQSTQADAPPATGGSGSSSPSDAAPVRSTAARAAADASEAGPDIIVSARRRAERLFDVPVAVSALGKQEIERYANDNIMKVAEMTPGLNIGARTAGGAGAGITIRGVGTDGSNVGIAQSVSISIDGIQSSQGRALLSSYFDLQQIEVMKGPQALFFGKNSPAGVIALTSANPTDKFELGGSFGYEFRADEAIGDAYISGPIGDSGLKIRATVHIRNMEGYIYNDARPLTTNDPAPYNQLPGAINHRDGEREQAGRLTFLYDAGGPFTANLKFSVDHYNDDGAVYPLELVYCGGSFPQNFTSIFGIGGVRHEPVGNCKPDWHTASSDSPRAVSRTFEYGMEANGAQFSNISTLITSLVLNYKLSDALTITSTTGYYKFNSANLMNNDWTSFATIAGTEGEKFRQESQEIRLSSSFDGPFNFMAGGYYEHEYVHFDGSVKFDDLPADPTTGKYQTVDKLSLNHVNTYSGFAQATYKIFPKLELSAGARYTHETSRGSVGNSFVNAAVAGAFLLGSLPGGDTSNNVSPEATLTYRPNHDLMIYGAYKTGYKSGGINLSQIVSTALTAADTSFKKEVARGFEGGIKAKVLDNKGSIQLTVYRYKYSGLQVSAYEPQLQSYIVRNAAASRNYGVELESSYRVTRDLDLHTSVAYNHSRYLSFPNAACYGAQTAAEGCGATGQNLTGRPTLTAPDWVATGGFDYHKPIGDYVFGLSADGYYSSSYYFIQTQAPEAVQGAFFRVNASTRISPASERWTLSLIGRNLTNRKVIVSGQDSPLSGSNGNPTALNGVLARPREILLQASFKL